MKPRKKELTADQREKLRLELRHDVAQRMKGYRERALAIYPHLCASCGREFSGARLKELTVHHKDHNHDNNPPDGGNWELLCTYCHDHEHEKHKMAGFGGQAQSLKMEASSLFNPFGNLDQLVNSPDAKTDVDPA